MSRSLVFASLFAVAASSTWAQGITAVVNAASFQSGLPSGGALATIFCTGLPLSAAKPGTYVAPASLPLPYVLGGLYVVINGAPSPLLAVVITSSGQTANAQINFQVPMERNASLNPTTPPSGYSGSVAVAQVFSDTVNGSESSVLTNVASLTAFPAPTGWGGFFAGANGYAIAQHASDYSLVTPQNPAHAGETIIAYADDFLPVWPPSPIGVPAPQQPLSQILPSYLISDPGLFEVSSTYLYLQAYPPPTCGAFLGQDCYSFASTPPVRVTFEGLAPGQIGVEQINFVVPANQQPGNWALFFNIGSCTTAPFSPGACGNALSSPYVLLPVQ